MLNLKTQSAKDLAATEQVTLQQAVERVFHLVGQESAQSFADRLCIDDPVVQVFALANLCEPDRLFPDHALAVAQRLAPRSAYLRQMLTEQVLNSWRPDLVDSIVALEQAEAESALELPQRLMLAQKNNDYTAQLELHEKLYLQTGNIRHLSAASNISRNEMSWPQAWVPSLRLLFTTTTANTEAVLIGLLEMLVHFDARDEFEALAREIDATKLYSVAQVFGIAQLCYWKKSYAMCVHVLNSTNVLAIAEDDWVIPLNLVAKCTEAMGDFRHAATWYAKQNKTLTTDPLRPQYYIDRITRLSAIEVPPLAPDTHTNYFIMTGFPRSATTLLENALAAHPMIATCEERTSLSTTVTAAYETTLDQETEANDQKLRAEFHRKLYYQSLDRYLSRPGAAVVIDKGPMLSAEIKYLEKLFPNKRYLFSIRHPYDVVISNWKQMYQQNSAMSSFNEIHTACVLYNHVMTNWFAVFPGESERVYYVRYEELVNDFRRVVEGALVFLGVEWSDEVLNFAEQATSRTGKTPSYAKVRQGLTIGVQSSWKDYEFLFDDKCRALLDPWCKHFGYAT